MGIQEIKDLITSYLEQEKLQLYDLKIIRKYGMDLIQIFLDKEGGIDLEALTNANKYISDKLDSIDADMGEYMLEVSSSGAEKELRNKEEILINVGGYVNIKTKDMVYEGELLSFIDDVVTLKINVKGQFKKQTIAYEDIKKIRLAVKF